MYVLISALLFRGLDAATTEEGILKCLNSTQMTCKNMQIIRDANGTSLGYGFLELSSVAESMNVLEILKALDPPLEVDGKQILVSFAKNTFSTRYDLFVAVTRLLLRCLKNH